MPTSTAPSTTESPSVPGGVLVSDDHARAFWILADVEGNELCICTWQAREG